MTFTITATDWLRQIDCRNVIPVRHTFKNDAALLGTDSGTSACLGRNNVFKLSEFIPETLVNDSLLGRESGFRERSLFEWIGRNIVEFAGVIKFILLRSSEFPGFTDFTVAGIPHVDRLTGSPFCSSKKWKKTQSIHR